MTYSKVINIILRAVTLASRFLFVFFMAKLLAPADLGLYGLVTAAIGYALFAVGFDFYTYTTRELFNHDRKTWGTIIKSQAALSLILYLFVLPTLTIIFTQGWLPWSVAKWFYVLIIFEHICQEMGRFFIAISEQLLASAILFIRQGTWAIVVTALMLYDKETRNLDVVLGAWVAACLSAIAIGALRIRRHQLEGWSSPIDWPWIATGIKIAVPMLLGTLAIRGIFTIDRYWQQALGSLDAVGAYVLFINIASSMISFLDAGVFSFSYPALIKAYETNDSNQYANKFREMLIQTTAILSGFSLISIALLPSLLDWIGNPTYKSYQYLYPWLLAASVLNGLSMIPHYALYSQKHDQPLIQSHVFGLIVFVIFAFIFSTTIPHIAIPASLCAAFLFIFLWKIFAYIKLTPAKFRRH